MTAANGFSCNVLEFQRAVVINDGKILKQTFSSSALAGRPRIKILDDSSRRRGSQIVENTTTASVVCNSTLMCLQV